MFFIAAGIERQLVVGWRIGPLPGRAHVFHPNTRYCLLGDQLSRHQAPMAHRDHAVFVNEKGVDEAKLPDAVGDLFDLLLGVRPRNSLSFPCSQGNMRSDTFGEDCTHHPFPKPEQ